MRKLGNSINQLDLTPATKEQLRKASLGDVLNMVEGIPRFSKPGVVISMLFQEVLFWSVLLYLTFQNPN